MGERVDFDPAELGRGMYPLLNSVVIPRPIAWVSTRSADGVDNLAPHSFFTIACVRPPVVQFTSVGVKDSLRNVLATREFVVCTSTRPLAEQVNITGTDFPPGESEFDAAGVTREQSLRVAPARVAESPVALECRLLSTVCFGDSTVVFGQVVHAAVDPTVLVDGAVDSARLAPVARLGKNEWSALGEVFSLRRVPYAERAGR